LGAFLQRLGCPRASGQGDGDHVMGRVVGRGMTNGAGKSKVDTWSVGEQFLKLPSHNISSEGCCLTLGTIPNTSIGEHVQ